MVKIHVGETPNNLSSTDFEELGNSTPGFSSSDMQRLVTEAEYEPVRELRAATHFRYEEPALEKLMRKFHHAQPSVRSALLMS